MPDTIDITDETAVARLVGKALRQRIGALDLVRDPEHDNELRMVNDEGGPEEKPFWLQTVEEFSDGTPPIITDAYGRRFQVFVRGIEQL